MAENASCPRFVSSDINLSKSKNIISVLRFAELTAKTDKTYLLEASCPVNEIKAPF